MAVTQETITLFDFAGVAAQERRRTTSKGTTSRVTIDYKSDPRIANLDPTAVLGGPARAAMKVIQQQIRDIAEPASEATQLKRKYATAALARGEQWAVNRYSGGRTGVKQPNTQPGGRLFNDSGRLADGIYIRNQKDGSLTINVPANRFDPSTFDGGYAAIAMMIQRLQSLVPALRSADELFDDVEVAESVRRIQILQKADPLGNLISAAKGTVQAGQELGEAVGEFGEEG